MDLSQYFVPFVEIVIIAVMIHYFLSFFWNTRAMDSVFGFLAFLLIFLLAGWLHLPVLEKIMYHVVNVAVLAVLIIFQPELRIALSKLSLKGKQYREITALDKFVDNLSSSVYRLSIKRIGALIVLENKDSLEEYAQKAVLLNAQFSSELLETIFDTSTPLHDGGVIIRGTSIVSAATILPLADESSQLTRSMGTRHRAGLGTSQLTDALVIVVSEESGNVSIAREGIMTRGVKIDRFKGVVRSIFNPPQKKSHFRLLDWIKE
ncbi:MAG: TIGR00159 family protein [Parachlamydiales bacterium]|nr:TIGR00159 family protein [Parachlamydiales bacterium]